ncbi:hypothetical protein HF324_27680 [Chitinophaga oryzae]|uniref:Uncharacterized protein n=1 Tax=Chitinophaga oryzae TaxID=2725414 RepID=A0AAE7D9I5_9BACT|nr:hypothetical protein [Chitinophaga oryzae]QJB34906.1 hypothetical protein HF329_27820 [Chitinophaga oryzae]QJB41417.1 hypothetical protein HF324_27680 [Chitinophaga oryzae]
MKRKLPLIDIEGTWFLVDVLHEELRQKDNPVNRISFSAFYQEGEGYTFLYDKVEKNSPPELFSDQMDPNDPLPDPDRYVWVTLAALMELDPIGIALKYDIPIELLCGDQAPPGLPPDREDSDEDEQEDIFH